ncbi:FAD/NAD(P)-binding domain-containing protein [Mycena amicta]|nr:FAD/NAD(P)-binding domain-containing protein [Mycena amicta]
MRPVFLRTHSNMQLLCLLAILPLFVKSNQVPFDDHEEGKYWMPPHPIRNVAVIGAGPAGLQAVAALLSHASNISVRLFERAPAPGGMWFYSEELPAREAYPDEPNQVDIPERLPGTYFYEEGHESLDERWREHWHPRPVWYDMRINAPTAVTQLPDVNYPPGTPWEASVHAVQRHVRAYASLHGLNVLDSPNITSYSTRVERLQKRGDSWALTLRRMQQPSGGERRLGVEMWEESFDTVVVATGHFPKVHVPDIPGIQDWSKVQYQDGQWPLYHAQSFRHAEAYTNKTVLIVGASVSATEIARAISPFVRRLFVSARPNALRDAYGLDIGYTWPSNAEIFDEILLFEPFSEENPTSLARGRIQVRVRVPAGGNSSDSETVVLEGIEEVVLATGYRRETFLPELVDPGPATMSNLHWTGHYIHDPTLAYALAPRPWTHGRYQSAAIAKVWSNPPTARLPSRKRMWDDYVHGKWQFGDLADILPQEALLRMYIAWLNAESLELGGRMVEPLPIDAREAYAYFTSLRWKKDFMKHEHFEHFDELPWSQWPKPGRPPA